MTAPPVTELESYVGRFGLLASRTERALLHPVRVLDARVAWARTDLLVTPVGGCGEAWVDSARVQFE